MIRSQRATCTTAAVLVLFMGLAVTQVVFIGAVDVAGWREDNRNARTNGWGSTTERPLVAADGLTPLAPVLDQGSLQAVRMLLGTEDDLSMRHGWFTRTPQDVPITTTIDLDVQRALTRAVDGRPAAAVVLDVETGRVIALGGAGGTTPVSAEPPGSVFKLVTYAAALDAGLVDAQTSFPIERSYAGVSNYGRGLCGGNLVRTLATSCNATAQRVGAMLGVAGLKDAATRFGFLDPERARAWQPAFTERSVLLNQSGAFTSALLGQHDTRVTPLYAASLAAAVANGGVRPTPTVEPGPTSSTRVMEARSAELLQSAMRLAVADGTATGIESSPGLAVGAKTGTAQSGLGYDHAWTVAFAPAHRPRTAAAVLVRGSPGHSRTGGRDAAPLAADLLAAASAWTKTGARQ